MAMSLCSTASFESVKEIMGVGGFVLSVIEGFSTLKSSPLVVRKDSSTQNRRNCFGFQILKLFQASLFTVKLFAEQQEVRGKHLPIVVILRENFPKLKLAEELVPMKTSCSKSLLRTMKSVNSTVVLPGLRGLSHDI